ncbi:MAG: hypothetical protein QXV73_04025 [Candidatus Micrarchaeia archaeon]
MANKEVVKIIKNISKLTDEELVRLSISVERELKARMNGEKNGKQKQTKS